MPGPLYFEWDKIVSLEATRQFDVTTSDGRRFLGSLAAGDPRTLVIREAAGEVSLPTSDVTTITPIGTSFWKKLDGSFDVGFSYTKSSDIAQLNVNSTTVYRRPAFEARLTGSATLTRNGDDGDRDDRGTVQASYLRYRGQRLFVASGAAFESNESLGLLLRSQVAVVGGPAAGQHQSGAAVDRRRPRGQRRAKRGRGARRRTWKASSRSGRRTTRTIAPARTSTSASSTTRASATGAVSASSSTRAPSAKSGRTSSWRSTCSTRSTAGRPAPAPTSNDVGIVMSFGWSY